MLIRKYLIVSLALLCLNSAFAQKLKPILQEFPLNSMEAFKTPSANWKIVGEVYGRHADTALGFSKGNGILLNDFNKSFAYKGTPYHLSTNMEHGDIYLEFDLMIPKGSNSGIYLQSRYEIQINDSWGVKIPTFSDMGGIYERWKNDKGFEGNAPLKNACAAPGLWQHMEISFQAPRFDANGNKTMPAKFNFVKLNGITLHENIFVSGPTRAAIAEDEKKLAPLMIQGDHGMIAIRNFRYAPQEELNVTVSDLTYKYYEKTAKTLEEAAKTKPTSEGKAKAIDSRLASAKDNYFLLFEGKLNIEEEGDYLLSSIFTGDGGLIIDGDTVIPKGWTFIGAFPFDGKKMMTKGAHDFKLYVNKEVGWARSGMSLTIEKANSKTVALQAPASLPERAPAPLINIRSDKEPELIRSFMFHQKKKLTHVISVGDPSQVHYSYNLLQGAMLYAWKGDYLNATDMWYERGEPQTSSPMGASINLPGICPVFERNNATDSIENYKYNGYVLNEQRYPVFSYAYKNFKIEDKIIPTEKGKGLNRTIDVQGEGKDKLMIRIAQGKSIKLLGNGLYSIDDQTYYVQTTAGEIPTIESHNGQQVLITPAKQKLSYQLIW